MQRVPAHVRDFQLMTVGRDLVDFATYPAQALRHLVLAAALGHELHAHADAEERPAVVAYGFFQGRNHARNIVEAAAAFGESTDAGQHHAVGSADNIGIARDHDQLIVSAEPTAWCCPASVLS